MDYKDLKALASVAMKNDTSAPVAFSFNDGKENYSLAQVNEALAAELRNMTATYADYRENKNTIYRLIEETIDEVLPARVEQQYADFAEVKTIGQGDRAVFRQKVTEHAKKRAKSFVTRVGLAGRYEVFMLDGTELEVQTSAIGGAARIGFEEVLDGRIQFSDLTSLLLEGMDEYILKEIAKALEATIAGLPDIQKISATRFDAPAMDSLLSVADAYGKSTIWCTYEFAATMIPDAAWASNEHKNTLWQNGYLGEYKGHKVIILPQSMVDETNSMKVIDPSKAYIMPSGQDSRPVKLVFEGQTCVREVEDNDDWSRDFQCYKKFGIATFANNWMCVYTNTSLTKEVSHPEVA